MSKSLALTSLLMIALLYTGVVQAQGSRQTAPGAPTQQAVMDRQGVTQQPLVADQAVEEELDAEEPPTTGTRQRPLPLQRTQRAQESMSAVAQEVQKFLADEDREGGIGEQVKVVAREQRQVKTQLSEQARERVQNIARRQMKTQEQVQTQLAKMDQRRDLVRSLIGPDFGAIKEVRGQITDNQVQIDELLALSATETDETAKAELADLAQTLTVQNEALAEKIQAEEQENRGLFGWLFRFMNR